MAKEIYYLKLHTGFIEKELNSSRGHDWTIYEKAEPDDIPRYFEGDDLMTLGEAKEFTELLNMSSKYINSQVTQARTGNT